MGDVGATMKSKRLAISGAVAISTFLGCGDSGDSGSGVAGDTLIKDVTGAEFEKVCRWSHDRLLSSSKGIGVRQACTYEIAPASSTKAECREEVDDCVTRAGENEEKEDRERGDPCEDVELPDVAAGCYGVTVSDYETCVESLISARTQVVNAASCNAPGEDVEAEEDAAEEAPAQCKTILQRCPSVLLDHLDPTGDVDDGGFGNEDREEL